MNIKEKITETAERLYDLANEGKYDVKVNLFSKKKNGEKASGVKVISSRDTAHTKKWRAKNR
ncbi:hypothetical protein JZO66_15120 [Enterococcus sp. DIV0242_7C1]|uniref:Uncharacterized protein n=1 Tax=Candidatus Enterococcus dunnyi TaxID=1834192 RepID=A0A200J8H8_9ENTE|nr:MULTISPECIES: hypothetical protein [unclassified Enterococcus]MBO0471887.1 hypothetical protein [Enterococcus sp. DIV0242_7C1]MCA5013260.1 hypothetical protein [Enterococcus sp. S23]MCA5016510.1 hypothetical protein [Enterococcus sp. S22(2020)]OUZ33484.1 hypothetical protein A5889_002199 [Enterococcus sp. 9D6_DIV0238]